MIIKSITITEGKKKQTYLFSDGANLIHSAKNTMGKTTLLRLILYSLGYQIPSTKNIHFARCITETVVRISEKTWLIVRENEYLNVTCGQHQLSYLLPEELVKFHQVLFSVNNEDVLNNLLGAFYVDQEKGWTLLNRGKVIGSVGFSIEKFVLGLSEKGYEKLEAESKLLEKEIQKYKQMRNISLYQQEIHQKKNQIVYDTRQDILERDLSVFQFDMRAAEKELREIKKTLKDNESFRRFVEGMNLRVRTSSGDEVRVTSENLIGYSDSVKILEVRSKMLTADIVRLSKAIEKLRNELYYESQQPTTETLIQAFDSKIAQISIDPVAVEHVLEVLNERQKNVKEALRTKTQENNSVLQHMYDTVSRYAEELNLNDYMTHNVNFMLTDNLKVLTGAVLVKMVFAFKLSYISAVEKILNIKLPIILDSPSGKELDRDNIQRMMNILDRDFTGHQILIASIFKYELSNLNTIELTGRVTG
jgi:hypothetical protein